MKKYSVVLSKTAEKELNILPGKVIQRIITSYTRIGRNPRPTGCKKLWGHVDL